MYARKTSDDAVQILINREICAKNGKEGRGVRQFVERFDTGYKELRKSTVFPLPAPVYYVPIIEIRIVHS